MEYKKCNIWSLKDLKTFIIALLKGPKRFEKIGEMLPHKTAKEIVFFYHTFKKLLKLKTEIKNSRDAQLKTHPSQTVDIDLYLTKQAEIILEPLIMHTKRQKIELGGPMSGQGFLNGYNQSFQSDRLAVGGGNSNSIAARNASKEAEKKMNQTQFNVDELLQVFSSANLGNGTRRRPKASTYASLHDSVISQHQNVLGLYPFNTFKIRPEFLGCPSIAEANPIYQENLKA